MFLNSRPIKSIWLLWPRNFTQDKLYHYGLRGVLHKLFSIFLHIRMQCTKIGTFKSLCKRTSFGSPQGSAMSLLLFLIYSTLMTSLNLRLFILLYLLVILLRSKSVSGKCTNLHTMAASNNKDYPTKSLLILLVRATYIYGCCSSRTSCSWWIAHSTQRRGCNNINLHMSNSHFNVLQTTVNLELFKIDHRLRATKLFSWLQLD